MNQRSYFGRFKRSANQIKIAFIFVGSVLIGMAGMIAVLLTKLTGIIEILKLAGKIDAESAFVLHDTLQTSLVLFIGIAATVAVGGLIFGVRISKQILGPMVGIKRFIDQLKEGRYDQQLRLRDGDDFEDIATSLNELARRLASQSLTK